MKRDKQMTEQQTIAITNYCRMGFETVNPKFGWLRIDEISIIVTVNSGYE